MLQQKIKIILHSSPDVWQRFYGGSEPQVISDSTKREFSSGQYLIDNVLFNNVGNEGVIRITNPSYDSKFLVSECTFINPVHLTESGAAINMDYSLEAAFVQYRSCSIGAQIPIEKNSQGTRGIHSYIYTENIDYIIESSISSSRGCADTFHMIHGTNRVSNVNVSSTYSQKYSGYVIAFASDKSYANFSTVYNTTALNGPCILYNSNVYDINHCNYFGNNCDIIIQTTSEPSTIYLCSFEANKCRIMFEVNSDDLTVDSCHISNSNIYSKIYEEKVLITCPIFFIECQKHLSNEYCPINIFELCNNLMEKKCIASIHYSCFMTKSIQHLSNVILIRSK